MLLNAETALSSSKVLLVPYSTWHVPRYHEWMQDEEIQQATASEPLTIEEEYAMQQSWRQDPDKLTFIICQSANDSSTLSIIESGSESQYDSNDKMIGDINLFLRVDDGEDEDSPTPPKIIGEIELMIAEKKNQRRGFGKAGLLVFLRYILERQVGILEEFVTRGVDSGVAEKLRSSVATSATGNGLRFDCLSVKIGQNNVRSLALFEGLGFVKLSAEPNFFGEFELRRVDLGIEGVLELIEGADVEDYREIGYTRKE